MMALGVALGRAGQLAPGDPASIVGVGPNLPSTAPKARPVVRPICDVLLPTGHGDFFMLVLGNVALVRCVVRFNAFGGGPCGEGQALHVEAPHAKCTACCQKK